MNNNYFVRFLDWWRCLERKWFPKHHKKWERRLEEAAASVDPNHITIEDVMRVNNSSRWLAEKCLNIAARRGEFSVHLNSQTGEKYWKLEKYWEVAHESTN